MDILETQKARQAENRIVAVAKKMVVDFEADRQALWGYREKWRWSRTGDSTPNDYSVNISVSLIRYVD